MAQLLNKDLILSLHKQRKPITEMNEKPESQPKLGKQTVFGVN